MYQTITAISAVGYALWFMGATLIGLSFIGPLQLAAIGLLVAGAGGVVQIRGFLCALENRERAAYNLGREAVRSVR